MANTARKYVTNAAATELTANDNARTEAVGCIANIIAPNRPVTDIARISARNVDAFTVAVYAVMSDVMAATIKSVRNAIYANLYVRGIRTIPIIMMTAPVIVMTATPVPIVISNI